MSSPLDAGSPTCRQCGRPEAGPAGLCAACVADATVAGGTDATRLAPPADSDATRLGPAPDSEATRLALTPDSGATRLAPPPDREVTRLGPGVDPDATRLGADADATRLGPPADDEATRLTPTPRPGSAPPGGVPAPGATAGATGPLEVGERFGRYTITRLLGMGGMGAVYQAWDEELEVVVALKVIRPEVLRDPAAEQELERRFKRELLLARQVTHKNVVRIHDLGEIRGIKYITMSYVDGPDLATLVRAQGRLPVPTSLRIVRSVVSGLVAAHTAGVVHRDLKPANIMIDADGEAVIMDFGIARSTGGPADGGAAAPVLPPPGVQATGWLAQATVFGTVVGTVEYMAPEQARGEAVDERADVYTTGLILYDLLTGRRRAEHPGSAIEQLRARMEGPLPAIQSIAPDVPDALAAVVTRAIEPDRAKRFQTSAEFAAALERLDEQGAPRPVRRVVGLPLAAGVVLALVALSGAAWWYAGSSAPPVVPDSVSVVIADFDNRTADPALNRVLEPTVRRALEGAGFITAFDRNGIRRTVGAALPDTLDEAAAREIAVREGLGVVLSGSIERQGAGYAVSLKATRSVTGAVVADVRGRASGPDQLLTAATRLVGAVRKALGDPMTESAQMFAMTSLSAASLEVVRHYAAAMESTSNNRFEDARQHLLKAVEIDPGFGVGYLVLSSVSRNLGRVQDARGYIDTALQHLDGMTERERFTTRGMYFRLTGDYQKCVEEHAALIQAYAADVIGRNQLALCASQLRDLARARDEMREVVKLLPKRAVFRDNLALYSNYSGDFAAGEQEARTVLESGQDAYAFLALGFALMGQGRVADAAETFRTLATVPGLGPTFSASGLGDAAAYAGRFAEAVDALERGAAADLAAKNPDRAAAKLAAAAYADLLRGRKAAAVAAAQRALSHSRIVKIRFLAARLFIEAGQPARAAPLVADLAAEVQPEPQAYAKILEAMVAMAGKDPRPAIKLVTDANALLDTWIGRFELGRAYLAAGMFPQADSEFDRCLKRRGEALALFLDEEPTYAYFPAVYYYQGRVREAMNLSGAADSYRAYLAIREAAGEDALLADLRRRIAK